MVTEINLMECEYKCCKWHSASLTQWFVVTKVFYYQMSLVLTRVKGTKFLSSTK